MGMWSRLLLKSEESPPPLGGWVGPARARPPVGGPGPEAPGMGISIKREE